MQGHVAHGHGLGQQLRARADGDGVRARVGREHIQWLAAPSRPRPTPRPRRWPTVKRVRARVLAQHAPVAVHDRAGRAPRPPWRARKSPLTGARQEAQVLRVGPARDRQPGPLGELAHLAAWSARRAGSAGAASDAGDSAVST